MKRKKGLRDFRIIGRSLLLFTIILGSCGGNEPGEPAVKLDPKNPLTITVWHYYNGAIMNAFEAMVTEFNETLGLEKGIIVEGRGLGSMTDLERQVISSAKKEVGSMEMPNIFATYADTAYEAEKMGLLADLGGFFSPEEQGDYIDSYIEEGRIGLNGELRIFPVAKSTEVFMINETDWLPFAAEMGFDYNTLATLEGLAETAAAYYHWTDKKTPAVKNDGKAFYGRDAMANMFIIASKSFGTEIFQVEHGKASVNVSREVMRKIWDCYYVPFISGYFAAHGRYRSDDVKVGDLLAYVGSTSSTAYFPRNITVDGQTHTVEAAVLPTPHFRGARKVIVQQGAGMVVIKGSPEEEYASIEFLKWFTDVENNIIFSTMSGYMPVKKDAIDYDVFCSLAAANNQNLNAVTRETLKVSFDAIKTSELYTNRAFSGGAAARWILDNNLQDKAAADRASVAELLEKGLSLKDAVARFNTDENFSAWLGEFTRELRRAAGEE